MQLSLQGINMRFGSNHVLHDVDFNLGEGEIHALLGENGAGKSTLNNILGGVIRPVSGRILIDGKERTFASPSESLAAGIAFIHQELNLINDLSVYENLFIGSELKAGPFLRHREMKAKAQAVLDKMNISVSPATLVGTLDASYKQIIEIARAILFDARIIIMDEPTTSLTEPEIERVFEMMRTLKAQGVSIIFVSHKLKEVMRICDSYTVLRNGVKVCDGRICDTNEAELARFMVGHDIVTGHAVHAVTSAREVMKVESYTLKPYFNDISFSLHAGEVLGFSGLLGDGRSELFQSLIGYLHGASGRVSINGRTHAPRSTSESRKLRIGYVPRNRHENGILPDLSIYENASIATFPPIIDHKAAHKRVLKLASALKIKYESLENGIMSLSGGNQQKVVLAKWLAAEPEIMIFDNPTQGVDVGAKEEIYGIISELADRGVAVVVLSSEAAEIERVCDRAIILFHGSISGELAGSTLTQDNIMLYALDAHTAEG